jgi:transcriptional regulator with XRE-family HTH domain
MTPTDDDDPRPAPDFYGQAMRTARMLRGYTLREVRDGTGVSVDQLSRYEFGAASPDPLDFVKVELPLHRSAAPRPDGRGPGPRAGRAPALGGRGGAGVSLTTTDRTALARALRDVCAILGYDVPALASAAAVDEDRLRGFLAKTTDPTRYELARLLGIATAGLPAPRERAPGTNGTRP